MGTLSAKEVLDPDEQLRDGLINMLSKVHGGKVPPVRGLSRTIEPDTSTVRLKALQSEDGIFCGFW
jgi:hypothetical protein